jgi:selenide,water dikinase
MSDPNLIVGMERPDDAGVYRLTDELALILTLDFFTPIVDDAYAFGQIAVANALSDVYAMGGVPKLALNIIGFPVSTMDITVLQSILKGGSDKLAEAGVLLVGGHSIDDPELKYGLSVTGFVHPEKVLKNTGAQPGDALILTKRIGTGIISTAIKADMAEGDTVRRIVASMSSLNRIAAECMASYPVNACTDITGFGLIGHACEMIEGTDNGMVIEVASVPVFPEALAFAGEGIVPAGAYRNAQHREYMVDSNGIEEDLKSVLFDPQTSGGLLISLPRDAAHDLLDDLHKHGISDAAIIGRITSSTPGRLVLLAAGSG